MKAPEKIYILPSCHNRWYEEIRDDDNIEYTRTDVFIEKAKQWLRYNNDLIDGDVADYVESFEKYMKGE